MNVDKFYNQIFDENTRLSGNDNRHKIELYRKRFMYAKLIEKFKPSTIVQIACGTGIHTHWICENYPDIKVYASDIIPKHVEQLNDYDNLDKRVWDCCDKVLDEYIGADMVIVEGAWYHLTRNDRHKLLENIYKIQPIVVTIDWLSAWHDTTQRMLQNKKCPANYRNPRPNEPFVFDTVDDLNGLVHNNFYAVKLFPVDLDLRFGFNDFNQVNDEEFEKYIELMNEQIQFYPPIESFIMNATEHGCYILWRYKLWT